MKRVTCMIRGGVLLTAVVFGVLAWRAPAGPQLFDDDGAALWWHPETPALPGAPLNHFTLVASGGAGRLEPVAFAPDLDDVTTGIRLPWAGVAGGMPGSSAMPRMAPAQEDDVSERFWTPGADAFDILGPRGEGRQAGWLQRDVSARQAEAMQAREAGSMVEMETFLRPGLTPREGGARILRFESIFDD